MVIKPSRFLFLTLLITYCLTSSDTGENQYTKLKYLVLFICVAYELFTYVKSRSSKRKFMKSEYIGFIPFVLIISVYSIYRSFIINHFSFRTVQELLFLVFPMMYGYLCINNWSAKTLFFNFRSGLILTLLFYIKSLNLNLRQIYLAIVSSSFGDSYSELESFTYCGLALAYFVFFCYYNDKKVYLILSALFVIMTFKRLFMVMAVALFVISLFEECNKGVSKKIVLLSVALVFAVGISYYFMTLPDSVSFIENQYGIDMSKFTMTRSDRLRWLLSSDWVTYGFGSSTEFMYEAFDGALEMDFTKIILELGFIPAFVLVYQYLFFSKKRLYTFMFMVFMLLNLIVSSGLTGTFSWSVYFIVISCISMYPVHGNRLSFGFGRKIINEEQFSKYSCSSL